MFGIIEIKFGKKEKSLERYDSENSSNDSVITFTEKRGKKANRSMENNKERIMNSSLMDILEDEARQRKNKNSIKTN